MKKLSLNKETLLILSASDFSKIAAGGQASGDKEICGGKPAGSGLETACICFKDSVGCVSYYLNCEE